MTTERIYLRPAGLVYGSGVPAVIEAGLGALLAGGAVAFTLLEVIARDGTRVSRNWHPWKDLAASSNTSIRSSLERLSRPRADIAGLSMAKPQIVGIVNVTPDSFSDGGQFDGAEVAIEQGRALAAAGAGLVDIGGESTRPGSDPVSLAEERKRVMPVIEALAGDGHVVSVDTRKAIIMREAAALGAKVLNDVSALTHDGLAMTAARDLNLPVCLMHAQGDPKTMQQAPHYDNVVLDVYDWLERRIEACVEAGIRIENIIADPGIGFGKTFGHNLSLIEQFSLFHGLGVPIMLGASRKAFIGALTGQSKAGRRVAGSIGAAVAGAMQSAHLLRVHDVSETVEALSVMQAGLAGRR